jgi:hypothetical protein
MKTVRTILILATIAALSLAFQSCSNDNNSTNPSPTGLNPDNAPHASIDRFSAEAGHLFVRNGTNNLPGPNQAINMDDPATPFKTKGLGPVGGLVQYYNFDVQSTTPANIYVLKRTGESNPSSGQLNIVDVKPGDAGYNDFWRVNFVTVPADYVANTVHSFLQMQQAGYAIQTTDMIVNCPIVPDGSTAALNLDGTPNTLSRGWYKDQVVFYFNFAEHALTAQNGMVPLADIYVCFNVNPDQPGGGPASGFKTEADMMQTHNVVEALPSSTGYSPLWDVNAYDNANFDMVMDLSEASMAPNVGMSLATVNCPIVAISSPAVLDPDNAPHASVDRFSADAAHLFVRTGSNNLPGPNEPINMDDPATPFKTKGLGPAGGMVQYYNFDVQSTTPADIYMLQREGESSPVANQLNIVNVKPGDTGYNDFWRVNLVTVPADYVANSVHNFSQIQSAGYTVQPTDMLVNCPIVPDGSTAALNINGGPNALHRGWYKDQVVFYFTFDEHALTLQNDMVPLADIYVCFNINPGLPGGGPASGFKTEMDMMQTHNVVELLPSSPGYSPLWDVNAYDNMNFDMVMNLSEASMAPSVGMSLATVNCPIVVVPSPSTN